MKRVKYFENFDIPSPKDMTQSKNWVDNNIERNLQYILKKIKYKIPKNLTSDELDKEIDKVREMAYKYFTENPKDITQEPNINFVRVSMGSIVPKTNQTGGVHQDTGVFGGRM